MRVTCTAGRGRLASPESSLREEMAKGHGITTNALQARVTALMGTEPRPERPSHHLRQVVKQAVH